MGGMRHLFYFNQAGNSAKILMHTRHLDGLEAPRNSLELPMDASQSSSTKDDNIPFSNQMMRHASKSALYQNGTPMKLLIDREISKEPQIKQRAPSVVARLMGVDKFPSDMKSPICEEDNCFSSRIALATNELVASEEPTPGEEDAVSKRSRQESRDTRTSSKLSKSLVHGHPQEQELQKIKPVARDHPQEQELQKFKREFEAWQTSKAWESSRSCGFDARGGFWSDQRVLAQERLNREKMARYTDAKLNTAHRKPLETGSYVPSRSRTSTQPGIKFLQESKSTSLQAKQMEALSMSNTNRSSNRDHCHARKLDNQQISPLPTRIVILKPGPERVDNSDDSQTASKSVFEEDEGSIKDLLEEVKERLIHGTKGNAVQDRKWRHNEICHSYFDRPTNPKEIAQQIADQVRDNVTRDMSSLRSKSQRSDFPISRPGSPEYISRDTRKFLSERLKNVLRNESDLHMPKIVKVGSRAYTLSERGLLMEPDFSRTGKRVDRLDDVHDARELKARSFRHDMNATHLNHEEVSPRNLIRSLSAPVSGTAFGRLLLEDKPFLTGAQIRRKHEMADDVSAEVRKNKKNRFNFRGTVSNLRYSLTLRGIFFGKKIQTVERGVDELGLSKIALPVPPVARKMKVQENSTEVPPSPVSACSDDQEELLCGPTFHSNPISTLDVPFSEDVPAPDVFQKISADIQEWKLQINQLGFKGANVEDVSELEREAEVYLRDILDAAGVFEDLDGISSFRCSSYAPIEGWVYEEVEEAYRKQSEQPLGSIQDSSGNKIEHRLLFDLLNEVLESKLDSFATSTGQHKSMLVSTVMIPSCKQLLADVCALLFISTHSPSTANETIEGLVTKDMETTRLIEMMHGDFHLVGRNMEKMILNELVEEVVIGLYS